MLKVILLLFSLVAASFVDQYYYKAIDILENSNDIDYEEVILLLKKSTNSDSYTKLGEIFLIGYPDKKNEIYRNYTEAYQYFIKGMKLGNSDSQFFLYIMHQENLLTNEFKGIIEPTSTVGVKSNLATALRHDGQFFPLAYVAAVLQCIKRQDFIMPEFLERSINENIGPAVKYPFLSNEQCQINRDLAHIAMLHAHKAVDHIERKGKIEHNFQRIDLELDNSFGDESEKLLKLLAKTFEEHSISMGYAEIGQTYMYGDNTLGIDKNPAEGMKFIEKALELGDEHAAATLGNMYTKGIGVETNFSKAVEYIEQAIAGGSVQAMITMGYLYRNGQGVEVNYSKAFEYTKMAADRGSIESLSNLAVFYLYGEGVEKNKEKALEYMQLAASAGYYSAKFNLGLMYFNGEGVEISIEKAFDLFINSIYEGQVDGYLSKAYKYFRQGNMKSAYLCYVIASALGYQSARLSLAYMFDKGLNENQCLLGKEYCTGVYLFRSIIEDNDQWAYEKLAKIFYNGGAFFVSDYDRAHKFYLNAPRSGEVLFALGYMYEEGLGCDKNYEKALEYYETIIYKAENKEIEPDAAYPATLAKYKLKSKMIFNYYMNSSF